MMSQSKGTQISNRTDSVASMNPGGKIV